MKPSGPVGLRTGERVRLIVIRRPDPARWDSVRLSAAALEDAALAEEGLEDWAKRQDADKS